jgi:hypothetical protein
MKFLFSFPVEFVNLKTFRMKNSSFMLLVASVILLVGAVGWKYKTPRKAKAKRITVVENKEAKRVDIAIDGKPFTSYIYPDVLKKPVLYPIRTSGGSFVTRGWPMDPRGGERVDHPHHVGMWFNYGDVNGHDFWNNSNDVTGHKGPFGTIRHQAIVRMVEGDDKAELEVTTAWQKPDGTSMLNESTTFIFSGSGNDRAIERITTLIALKENVLFKDNKEGLVGIRVARELEHPSDKPEVFTDASGNATNVTKMSNDGVSGKYRSSEGTEGDNVWGTRAKWVNLNGTIGKEAVSLVILDNAKNTGFPTYWHARGYGLFAANPLGQNAMSNGKETLNFMLPVGKSVTFRYKVLVHSGSHLSDEQVNESFSEFSK